jgi:hypothetical protein
MPRSAARWVSFPSYESLEGARLALGDTRRLADRLDLARMKPASALSSTRYALADPGQAYVVFEPNEGDFSVELEPGTYGAEWFSPAERTWSAADPISADDGQPTTLTPPSAGGGWVVRLEREG